MTTTISQVWLWPLLLIVVWDLVWRGMALWRAARLKQTVWFVLLLILNTAGILPIIYLLITNKEYHGRSEAK